MQIVSSVVLSSGPDEALMGRCALVMADWSADPKFAQEIALKTAAGKSLTVLMRSVATTTRVSQLSERPKHRGINLYHSCSQCLHKYFGSAVLRPILAEGGEK